MTNGVVNVYKEQGFTSFDVCAKMRGIFKQKKIGHTGTLDPMAEGVLVVTLGSATKISELIVAGSKQYEAEVRLGITSDTDDITGTILTEQVANVTPEEISSVIDTFVGKSMQVPPMYSAIKKDGKKLYEYAREGIEIEREARPIEIYSIQILSIDMPNVRVLIHCSKGTYIRSLAHDIGEKLGCGAVMSKLIRHEVHGFKDEDAYTLSRLQELKNQEKLEEAVRPMDELLIKRPAVTVKDAASRKLLVNGNKLKWSDWAEYEGPYQMADPKLNQKAMEEADFIRVYLDQKLFGLYRFHEETKEYKNFKMLAEK